MSPEFSRAVDPIFLYVLRLLDAISQDELFGVEEARDRIQNLFRQADAELSDRRHQEGWQLAKYGLVAWIDDMLIDASWRGRDWWENNSLEFFHFNTRSRATEFFKKASAAAQLTRRDALEVFYVCVVLGFRGFYSLSDATFLAEQLDVPVDIESWARRAAKSIELGHGRPQVHTQSLPGSGAPPLEGKLVLVGTSLAAAVLAVFTAVVGYFVLFPQ
jgi:type VI secretion system protein ImpK